MCPRCFHATNHVGHNVSFFIAQQSGGSCDCGDFEAWRNPINCPFHPPADEEPITENTATTITSTPRAAPKIILAQDIPPVKNYPYRASVPNELRESMSRTVAYALDFILDTLDYSPDDTGVPEKEADIRLQPSADPMSKEQYCALVWNDDKHSFDEVIRLVMSTTRRTREEAAELAGRVDEHGRDILETSADVPHLLEIAHTFSQVDLGVTVRRAYDTFREQMACTVVEWLFDLVRARLLTDTLILREILAAELLTPRKKGPVMYPALREMSKVLPDEPDAARLDWMFMYHTKLWRKPRLQLKEVYATILSVSQEHKLAVGRFLVPYRAV